METKKRFAANLAEGMERHGLSEQQLANELDLDRYWRKWLRRVLTDGLERPNANTIEMLEKLAKRLGFGSAKRIWLGHFDDDLAKVEAFREIWMAADRPLKQEIEGRISEWQQEVERQVIKRRRIQVAELIARMKFGWEDLSSEERFAMNILTPKGFIGIRGEELDMLDHHGLMSKVVFDIIVEKELSPESSPNDIWQIVRPEMVRIVEERLAESRRKFPQKTHLDASVPE